MKDLSLLLAGAILAGAGCKSTGSMAGAAGGASEEESAWIQKPAPEFKLKDPDGKEVSLSSFRGKPVLLNFWGISCPICQREIPSLVRLHDRYGGSGLVILGVNVRDDEKPAQIKEFAGKKGIRYALLVRGSEVANRYGIEGIPANFFIDAEGKVISMALGFDGEENLESPLKKILPRAGD